MKQAHHHLSTYLNDHLAGSVMVIHLLEHLQETQASNGMKPFLRRLHDEVVADRLTLEALMQQAQVGKQPHRPATAWLVEKLGRLKLWLDDPDGALHLLEALELVEVGIEGKREL